MMFAYIYIVLLAEIPAVLGVTLNQGQKALSKAAGKTLYLPCKVAGLQSWNYIHWYQMRDGEAPSRLLYINEGGAVTYDTNNPQANDFTVDRRKLYDLKLGDAQQKHTAVYFCAYWDSSRKIFGSGTRLIVTEPGKDSVVTPKLSGYLNKANEKPAALCQAKDMFPDLVSFKWEKKSSSGGWTEVSNDQIVEHSHNEDPVTSMVILNTPEDNIYRCTVTHEGSKDPQQIEIKKKDEKPSVIKPSGGPDPTCPPSTETPISQESANPEKKQSLQLFVYGYAVMLMKNVLYFIVVFIVLLKRKAAKKEERS